MADKSGGGNGGRGGSGGGKKVIFSGSSAGKSSSSESGSLFSGQQPDLSGATGKGGSYSGDRPMLDPDAELSRSQSATQKDVTQQLGAATQMAQFMSGVGQSAAANENRRYWDNLDRQRVTGLGPRSQFKSSITQAGPAPTSNPLEVLRKQMGLQTANQRQQAGFQDYYSGLQQNRDFQNQSRLQGAQLEAQKQMAGIQAGAQLGSAALNTTGNILGSLFGSVSAGTPSGRYW